MEPLKQSTHALISVAAEHEYAVTRTQLARWHRIGILPRPEQRSLGRRGTESLYPPGTAHQLLALCAIHRTEKRLQHIAWTLWWSGFAVSPSRIREMLEQFVVAWTEVIATLVEPEDGGLSDLALDYIDDSEGERLDNAYLRRARKRVQRDQFPTFVRVLLDVARGAFTGLGGGVASIEEIRQEQTLVEDGLGLTRARIDRVGEAAPWLQGEIEKPLQELSHLLGEGEWGLLLAEASDTDLEQARDQARRLIEGTGANLAAISEVFGRDSFGFTGIVDSFLNAGRNEQALLLLFILNLQHTRFNTALLEVIRTARQAETGDRAAFKVLQQLRAELPMLADILSPRNLRKAYKSEQAYHSHLEELQRLYREHQETFDTYWRTQQEAARSEQKKMECC